MKWQDSTKVIITQKLHRIRNWEFQNMSNGMCTIEMIENLKIENSTKMWVCAISPYERRFVWKAIALSLSKVSILLHLHLILPVVAFYGTINHMYLFIVEQVLAPTCIYAKLKEHFSTILIWLQWWMSVKYWCQNGILTGMSTCT